MLSQTKKTFRFSTLLVSLAFLLVLYPAFGSEMVGARYLDIFFSIVLISGVYAVASDRRVIIFAIGLAVCSIVLGWLNHFFQNSYTFVSSLLFHLIFVGLVSVSVFHHVIKTKEVTADTLVGSICVYFLICLFWAFIYGLIEYLKPGSFSIEIVGTGFDSAHENIYQKFSSLFYYSFVTLTTLGYGDIIPTTPVARSFATLEAVFGQLYLTILVARLVGMHISQSRGARVFKK